MKIYSSQPIEEFLQDVRDRACQANSPPALIHKIDELMELGSLNDRDLEIEKLNGELDDMKKARDDLHEELEALYTAILDTEPADLTVRHPSMVAAEIALARHKD